MFHGKQAEENRMAFNIKNDSVASETISLRVVRVGHVDRWLNVATNIPPDGPDMGKLITDAHAFLEKNKAFAGVDIQSAIMKG
jgi:hypothetical protein